MYIFYVIYFYSFLYYFSSSAFLDLIWLSFYQSVSQFSRSVISDFVTPWTAAHQASLSITNSQSLLNFMSTESVMPSNHLILCHPLLLRSIFPSIRVFSSESVHHIRWAKYWSFSFSISPSNEYSGLISFRIDWFDFLAVQMKVPCVSVHGILQAKVLKVGSHSLLQDIVSTQGSNPSLPRCRWIFYRLSHQGSPAVQGILKSLLKHHSLKASVLQCSAFFIVQLSQPAYIHDYWKNHSFDFMDLCQQSDVCFLICCLGLS